MKINKEVVLILFSVVAIITSALFTYRTFSPQNENNQKNLITEAKEDPSTLEKLVPTIFGYPVDSVWVIKEHIKKNESITEILHNHQIPYDKIYKLADKAKSIFDVRKIAAHKNYTLICTNDSVHKAKCFVYHPNKIDYVVFNLEDSLNVFIGHKKVKTQEKVLAGVITSSLYKTIVDLGADPTLANILSDVYAWEIDFFGLQEGDRFKVVFNENLVDGEVVSIGEISSCQFIHNSKNYYAFKYMQDGKTEYFDEKGESLRKSFLKAPLNFTRISSKFSNSRLHPILKIKRPHHGVDYAAPLGTPVVAIGDGKVIYATYTSGAGNYIKIKHNGTYTTGYMHLHKMAKGLKVGSIVSQGEIIGYVGSTGLSTGPHLDFRFWKNNIPIDPLTVDPPSSAPIHKEGLSEYLDFIKKSKLKLDKVNFPGEHFVSI